jgi:hypothetical protein
MHSYHSGNRCSKQLMIARVRKVALAKVNVEVIHCVQASKIESRKSVKQAVVEALPETANRRETPNHYEVEQASEVTNHCCCALAERLPALLHIVHQQLLLWHTRLHFLHPPVVKRDEVIPVTVPPIIGSWMAPQRSPTKLVELVTKRAAKAHDGI